MKLRSFIVVFVVSVGTFVLQAAPAKLATCQACHGARGVSSNEVFPNLSGQKKDYIIKQLKDFQSGQRKDVMMYDIARRLTEKDMENLASYFSQLNP